MLGVGSPTFQWNPIARDVVQRPAPCGNLSEMIPTDYFSLRQTLVRIVNATPACNRCAGPSAYFCSRIDHPGGLIGMSISCPGPSAEYRRQ